MSADFKTSLVVDPRLLVTDQIDYAVVKGAQQMNCQQYEANSKSTSSLVFSINLPSEQTIVDRRILLRTRFTLKIVGTPTNGNYLLNLGTTDALSQFPIMRSFTTMTMTLNNNSLTLNSQDVIDCLMRSLSQEELASYNGMCPNYQDTYANYADGVNAINNPNGSYVNSTSQYQMPRGAFGQVLSITGNSVGDGATQKTVYVQFETVEPIIVSPAIFSNPVSNAQGMYGLITANFIFNFAANANRTIRIGSTDAITTVSSTTFESIDDAQLLFNFLTPQSDQLLSARNCVPYQEFQRYIQSYSNGIAGLTAASRDATTGIITPTKATLNSTTVQLPYIPDKLFVYVRKGLGKQTARDSDSFLAIKKISINFNNSSGILSSANQSDLYKFTKNAGLNSNWQEFTGHSWIATPSGGKHVPTVGSILALNFGEAIQISDPFYAVGSLGSFQLQFTIDVENWNPDVDYSSSNTAPELVFVTLGSGVCALERGTSSVYLGLLSKSQVLETSQQEAHSLSQVHRSIGGGFFDRIASVAGKILPKALPIAKAVLGQIDNPLAQKGAELLGSLGMGRSGGAKSKLSSRLM